MKNDPDYEAWVLGYTAENRSVRNPFFGWPGVVRFDIINAVPDQTIKFKTAGHFFVSFNAHNCEITFSVFGSKNGFGIFVAKCGNFVVIIS